MGSDEELRQEAQERLSAMGVTDEGNISLGHAMGVAMEMVLRERHRCQVAANKALHRLSGSTMMARRLVRLAINGTPLSSIIESLPEPDDD